MKFDINNLSAKEIEERLPCVNSDYGIITTCTLATNGKFLRSLTARSKKRYPKGGYDF